MCNGLIVQQLKTISFWPLGGSGISCMPIRLTYHHLNELTHINPDSQYKSYKSLPDKNPIFTALLAPLWLPPTPEGNI